MSDFMIKALTAETFDDFAALVERSKGMFASRWCTWFHPDCEEKGQSAEGNRALKQRLVGRRDRARGAGLRRRPGRRLGAARITRGAAQHPSPQGVRRHRRATARRPGHLHPGRGLTARHGRVRKKDSSFLYTAPGTMYERGGFTYDRSKGQGNCVMVREVAPSARG